jgi:ribosome-binding ATPase YchF (GTP1/OBG family)
VVVHGKRQVPGWPILIGARLPYAAGCVLFGFFQGFRDRSAMCFDQPIVAP